MCIICVEFQKQRLTVAEARRNLGEMVEDLDDDHLEEVEELLDEYDDADVYEKTPQHDTDGS
jgi:hypothetical protein